MAPPCPTCDDAVVFSATRPDAIDVRATTDALIRLVDANRMTVLRGDVPLDDMIALAASDLKYTIVTFLHCTECHRTRFWGLCIRGEPIYRTADAQAVARWRWESVPPREQWAD